MRLCMREIEHLLSFPCSNAACMLGKAPGLAFGYMGLPRFANDVSRNKGDACFVQLETTAGMRACLLYTSDAADE